MTCVCVCVVLSSWWHKHSKDGIVFGDTEDYHILPSSTIVGNKSYLEQNSHAIPIINHFYLPSSVVGLTIIGSFATGKCLESGNIPTHDDDQIHLNPEVAPSTP